MPPRTTKLSHSHFSKPNEIDKTFDDLRIQIASHDDRMAAVQCFRAYIAEIDRTNSSDANNGSDGTSAKLEPTLMQE